MKMFERMPWYYNCGGFALGIPEWVRPIESPIKSGMFCLGEDTPLDLLYEAVCLVAKRYHLNNFRFVEDIMSFNSSSQYLVAFRTSDSDFHFMRRLSSGEWVDKRGSSSYIHTHSFDEIITPWYEEYDSRMIFFAVDKSDDFEEIENTIHDILLNNDGEMW